MAGFFETLFGGGAEREAAERNRALYNQYQQQGTAALESGLGQSRGFLDQALGVYTPLSDLAGQYRQGTNTYLGALGIGTPEQQAAARSAFTTSPGYQFALDQGLDAINRRRAITGMYNSGNADIDTLKFSQGLANQEYSNWLDRLSGINSNALSATGATAAGQAGGYGSLANLYQQNAQNQISLYGNTTSGLAQANNTQAAGEAAGAKNLLGAGLGLASLFTGGGGIGGALTNAGGRAPGYAPSGLMRLFG